MLYPPEQHRAVLRADIWGDQVFSRLLYLFAVGVDIRENLASHSPQHLFEDILRMNFNDITNTMDYNCF